MRAIPALLMMLFACCFFSFENATAIPDTLSLIKEDSINARSLIISEVQMNPGEESWSYVELYNTSDIVLDLSRYVVFDRGSQGIRPGLEEYESKSKIRLSGTLDPGKTFLLTQWYNNNSLDPFGRRIYPNGYINVEAHRIADREGVWSTTAPDIPHLELLHQSVGLLYVNQVKTFNDSIYPDSIFIDRFGYDFNDITLNTTSKSSKADAVAPMPIPTKIYARRYDIKKGNMVDNTGQDGLPVLPWDASSSSDILESEWISLPLKQSKQFDKLFTSVDYHGPQPDLTLSSDSLEIDFKNNVITMPYGVSRDSVFRLIETGPNHAWELQIGLDTGQFFVQEDDSLFFYTVGNTLNIYKFSVRFVEDEHSLALVAPLVYKTNNEGFTTRFYVSNGISPMDTIGTIPYNMPIDTFFVYMVKPEGAAWDIIPADLTLRPEVKDGDILKVYSADGENIKEYRLCVLPFIPNQNAKLKTIYFPGSQLWENPNTFIYTDTMVQFQSDIYSYTVVLPADSKTSPPIVAAPEDDRSTVIVNRAKNLFGSEEERTVSIVVTAEDDTSILTYTIRFTVDNCHITSNTYNIDSKPKDPYQIYGVTSGTSFGQFLENVNKTDPGIVVKAFADDGNELSSDAILIQGTNIWSWSSDGYDSVNYVINIGSLSSNCSLTSTKYTVETRGATGTISGIQTGTSLKDLLSDLTVSEFSKVVTTDGGEQVIPMEKFNMDTIEIYFFKRMISTIATEKTYIEVTAQDQNTKCLYKLMFLNDDDPFVVSDVYLISQKEKYIDFVKRTSPRSFLSNLIPSKGATLKLMNKYGQERHDGLLEYSDHLIVSNGNKQTRYYLNFLTTDYEWWWRYVYSVLDKGIDDHLIYPNPTSNFISLKGFTENKIEIWDMSGRLIIQQTIDLTNPTIDLNSLKPGIYILKTRNASFKIVKQ